ncbi:uncharacterized protein PHACADRAFT_199007 [Phanerochaete carnosa HHB-10118-sp]|uniref:AAA+ ATPase domain-containing protein n=1 Tax=Phanerochaete carnosa (strain HHB-10118-sp) TaxID=650164 RepID=K5VJI2_PHACS|nr:uncharacterized protein PHACADRAFT_199007 [Phanerochaete carnosa HHB-10118-sp]EKM51498.1 hypothetical protein PHACADRAFT_199007 [Phanerochaete carnosa HHB-10118-sp]
MEISANNGVSKKLKEFRDTPVAHPSNQDLYAIFNFLVLENSPAAGQIHWFCAQARPLVTEAASFLLRLHAYNSPLVVQWRAKLQACLAGCSQCVGRLPVIKDQSQRTYLEKIEHKTLQQFWDSFAVWELEIALKYCEQSNLLPIATGTSSSSSDNSATLLNVPPSIVLLMLSNLQILRDPRTFSLIRTLSPDRPISAWPLDSPPAGLLLLLMDEDKGVRTWAYQQVARYTTTPMPLECFIQSHVEVLVATVAAVSSSNLNAEPQSWSPDFSFSRDPLILWSGYATMLRFVPPERMGANIAHKADLRKAIVTHLSDTGTHFFEVLKVFILLLPGLGPELWQGESENYPLHVFNIIKNNRFYASSLEPDRPEHGHGSVQWIEAYVKSLGELPALRILIPPVIQYLCEELQHERYKDLRASAVCVAAKLLDTFLAKASQDLSAEISPLLSAVLEPLDIHANVFTSVAFGKSYVGDVWAEARCVARSLIRTSLRMDVGLIFGTIRCLAATSSNTKSVASSTIHEQIWRRMYELVLPDDSDGIAMIITVLSDIAHVDDLHEGAFGAIFGNNTNKDDFMKAVHGVNLALEVMRTGFSDSVSRYLDFTEPRDALAFLRQYHIVGQVTTIMFSPVAVLRQPVQSLIGFALDAESRADCFRALLELDPDRVFEGMYRALQNFTKSTTTMPEACNLSKALALCLTDVIDVLSSSSDGLLHRTNFLQSFKQAGPEVQLPKWWSLMCQALTHIFQRTPRWADYFENGMMVTWMRDALIFGRDMLAQRKLIESGALALSPQSLANRGKSHIGSKMVDGLQAVLLELTRWLRLTDEELLFQAFALLQSMLACFQEAKVKPSDAALQKLQKHIKEARTRDPKRPLTRLDSTRVDRLQDAISMFEDKDGSDDEIQIIAHRVVEPVERRKRKDKAEEKVKAELKPVSVSASVFSRKAKTPFSKSFRPEPARRPSGKAGISSYFTADDRKKLNAAASMSKFSKSTAATTSKPPAAAASKPVRERVDDAKSDASSFGGSAAPTSTAPSSDESDSDGGEESGLAALAKLQKTPTIKKAPERRQVMMLDLPGTVSNPALERLNQRSARDEARRTALRLKPDITPLHRTMLSWNYDHDGSDPPGERLNLVPVPDSFKDEQHYRRVFEPLLLSECWAQIQSSKTDTKKEERYACTIVIRQYSGEDWIDLDIAITDSVHKEWTLTDADLVLLKHFDGKKSVMCKVQNYRSTPMNANATLRMVASQDGPGPQTGSSWMISKITSLTTIHREYSSLMALPYYDLCPAILDANLLQSARANLDDVNQTMKAYNLNEPQANAILSALRTAGFSLIQGPPGTGKTSTICGLVQAFLAKRGRTATAIHAGRNSGPADKEPKKKILLCAPSNAAIDEITYRLKEGISGPGRQLVIPKVVRTGGGKVGLSVRDVTLDYLVEQKMNTGGQAKANSQDVGSEIALLRSKLEAVKHNREAKRTELLTVHDNTARTMQLEDTIRALNKERTALTSQLDKLRDQQKSNNRTFDAVSRKFRAEILQDADVICTTLAGSGHDTLEPYEFEMVVIDEAAQAVELSSLIPLKYRCQRCVMVGDPQQLPPTVQSQQATGFSYNQSLFVRLQKHHPEAVHLLSIQYRMHPDISLLPSRLFYNGRLLDGPDMASKTQRPWHRHPKFGPYRFYNVHRGVETTASHSYLNQAEAEIAVALYNRLRQEFSAHDFDFKIGIVTMYKAQMLELRRAFERRFGTNIHGLVDFNTVDGFQGQEKEIIVLSCVRAGPGVERVGFLRDVRRMNVALTRAKSSIFILGNAATLERSDEDWRTIVKDARERSCLVDVDVTYFTSAGSASIIKRAAPARSRVSSKQAAPLSSSPTFSTPQELVASNQRPLASAVGAALEVKAELAPILAVPTQATPSKPSTALQSTSAEQNAIMTAQSGQKRPAEDNAAAEPEPKRRPPPPADGPRPPPKPKPPVKERKKPSIFMPSKRPAMAGDAGPSANRRRI